jgi:hypothetical protein
LRLALLYHVSPQELFDEMYKSIANPSSSTATEASEERIPAAEQIQSP